MAVSVDSAGPLIDMVFRRMKPLRDALLLAGLYYTSRVALKGTFTFYQAVKTFALPLIWPRNFSKEYGKWAVITGATRGIGKCYAKEMAKRGMNILLIGRNEAKLSEIRDEIIGLIYDDVVVEYLVIDFAKGLEVSYENIENFIGDKDIGILVNNVGVIPPYPMYFDEISEAIIWNIIHVNIAAGTMMTKLILPLMMKKGKGAIVNISSSAALQPQPLQQIYTASKAYMDFLSKALAYEYPNITIQTISPMYVCTDMVGFSPILRSSSIFVPSPEAFVSQAIRTIGFNNETTGYWSHSLQTTLMNCFADVPKIWIAKFLNVAFRYQYLKEMKKEGPR